MEKVPYMIIIGEKEAAGEVLSIRSKAQGDMGIMTSEEFIQMINKEIKEKVR
jgi:threonyl-tRNA synthetase